MTHTPHVPVIIIGAGVAGLTLANLLQRNGIRSTILEKHPREYVEQRQRAGTIDTRGVRMFREWGLAEVLEGTPIADSAGGFYIDGDAMPMDVDDDNESVFCPQQVLVRNLADILLRGGGDIRYSAANVRLIGLDTEAPRVEYRDTNGSIITLEGQYVAGCDGDRGISRASIPTGVLTRYSHEYGYAWLSVFAEASAQPSGMAIHSRGLAGIIPRGERASRLYLQIPLSSTLAEWTVDRIWTELEARFGTAPSTGPVVDKQIVPLRSVVYDPMRYGNLYLLGDAAHIVPPMSAKGINLALNDSEVLARGILEHVNTGGTSLLDRYSDTCLAHVWNYQAFAAWITDIMHNAGDPTYEGDFRKQIARAELQRQFVSPAANRLFSELTSGTN